MLTLTRSLGSSTGSVSACVCPLTAPVHPHFTERGGVRTEATAPPTQCPPGLATENMHIQRWGWLETEEQPHPKAPCGDCFQEISCI